MAPKTNRSFVLVLLKLGNFPPYAFSANEDNTLHVNISWFFCLYRNKLICLCKVQ